MALQRQNHLRKGVLPPPAPAGQFRGTLRSLHSPTDKKRWRHGLGEWVSGFTSSSSTSTSSTSTLPSPPANNQQDSFPTNYPPRSADTRQFRPTQSTVPAAHRDSFYDNNAGRGRPPSRSRPDSSAGVRPGDYPHEHQDRRLAGPVSHQPTGTTDKELPLEPDTASPNGTSTKTTDVALADKLAAALDEIKRLSGINDRLREKVSHAAASRTEADPLTTSRVPENVIITGFRTLVYRIRNFVANYYKDESAKDLEAWAEMKHHVLSTIHPDFVNLAVDKTTSTWLIEAVIWNLLVAEVFSNFGPGEGKGMLWAGRYSTRVWKLSHLLSYSMEANDPESQRAFHHWRALTTSLIPTGDSQQMGYRGATAITDMLEDLLEPFSSPLKGNAVSKGLEAITNEAIELDHMICRQQICYRLRYPARMLDGEAERTEVVGVPAAGKAGAEKKGAGGSVVTYSFVVTPLLDRSGGRRGEGYGSSECLILEPAQVYVGSHPKSAFLLPAPDTRAQRDAA